MAHFADTEARQARLAEIKRQIAAGEYETAQRLDAAVDALLDDLTAADKPPRETRRPK